MTVGEPKPLGLLLRRPPRYGINAAAVPLVPGVPTYIRITDIDEVGRFAPDPKVGVLDPKSADYRMGVGELVFARTGASVGKSYLYDPRDGELVYAGFLINIAPDPKLLHPKYLSLFVHSKGYWDWIARTSVRSGQPGVNGREFAQLPVPLPDIAVQNAIADVMTDADHLIASLERLITKKAAIRHGMMQRLLSGKTRLSGFTGSWRRLLAGEVGTFKGGSGFPVRYQGASTGKYPFYKVSDMNNPGNERFMKQSNNYLSEAIRKQVGAVIMPKDSIVFAKVGAAIFQERKRVLTLPSCIDNNMAAFILDPTRVDVRFMLYALSNFKMGSLVATTAMPSINGGQLRSIPLAMPPSVEEQRSIAEVLADSDVEIDLLKRRFKKACEIKAGMMQELLSGRTGLPVSGGAA